MTRFLADLGNVCIWAASAGLVVFVVQYTLLSPWWRDVIGQTIVGLDLCLLAIFVPSLLALADPHFGGFASSRWYFYLSVGVVVFTAVMVGTRIVEWERIRRQRRQVFPEQRSKQAAP